MHKFTLAISVILLYIVLRANAAGCFSGGGMHMASNQYNTFITYFNGGN